MPPVFKAVVEEGVVEEEVELPDEVMVEVELLDEVGVGVEFHLPPGRHNWKEGGVSSLRGVMARICVNP
jgi:hypothetical protein